MKAMIATVFGSLFLTACATSEVGSTFDYSAAQNFQEGHATRDQVEAKLGEPRTVTTTSRGDSVLVYQHIIGKANGLTGKASSTGETVIFVFDQNGLLTRKTVSTTNSGTK